LSGERAVFTSLNSRMESAELYSRLDIKCIPDIEKRSRLQWLHDVEQKNCDDVFRHVTIAVEEVRDTGRDRMT